MACQDKTHGPVMTTSDGSRLSFVSRSDAGGEVVLLIECPYGSHLPITVVLARESAKIFATLAEDAFSDAFGVAVDAQVEILCAVDRSVRWVEAASV